MRVALLTPDWLPNGGIASHVRLLAPALASAGHHVLVLHAGALNDEPRPGVTVRGLPGHLRDNGHDANVAAIRPVVDVLRAFAPDVLHVHGNANFPLGDVLRAGFPMLHTVHALDLCPAGTKWHSATDTECHYVTGPMCLPRMVYLRCMLSKRPHVLWRHYVGARMATQQLRAVPEVVVASEYVRQLAITNGVDGDRVTVVPIFTDPPATTVPIRDHRTILYVGRVVHEKGLDLLLSALATVDGDWRLVVAGDGIGMARLRQDVERAGLGGRVQLRGWLNDDALTEAYRDATVVVVPSRWPEPFGTVGIEAFAHARPVVAFATGGIPEWLRDGDGGYLAPQGDVRTMGARIQQLLNDPADAARVAAQGRARVLREFSAAAHLARLLPIYERVRGDQR